VGVWGGVVCWKFVRGWWVCVRLKGCRELGVGMLSWGGVERSYEAGDSLFGGGGGGGFCVGGVWRGGKVSGRGEGGGR